MATKSEPSPHDAFQPSSKRQKTSEANNTLANISAANFTINLHLYSGDQAEVAVAGQTFTLPKKLLCYSSRFFEAALNSPFQEGVKQAVELPGFKAVTFQQIVQWLYQGKVIVDPLPTPARFAPRNSKQAAPSDYKPRTLFPSLGERESAQRKELSRKKNHFLLENYFEFLRLADYIDLQGPFDDVFEKIRVVISKDYQCLSSQHIQAALALPDPERRVLKVIASSLGRPYVEHMTEEIRRDEVRKPFKFQQQIDDSDIFAAELLKSVGVTLPTATIRFFKDHHSP